MRLIILIARKMLSKVDKILIKNIATKSGIWYEELLAEFPINVGHSHCCEESMQWKIDDTGTVNRQDNSAVKA